MDSKRALQAVANIIQPNLSTTEVITQYDNWSSYDEVLDTLGYNGPKVVADAVEKYLSDKGDVNMLDVAAGTGLAGVELKARGFNNLDALDPSEGMLSAAKEKNIYRKYILEFFPCDKPSIATSSYDVLVVLGGMAEGHMKCDCLPEMVRCVKTGGLVVISIREDYLTNVAEYNNRFEPLMKQLEMDGQWQLLERTVVPNVYHTYNGVLFVLRVSKAS